MQIARALISEELAHFNNHLEEIFSSDVPLLNKILGYLVRQKGKQIRPMFTLLCARLGGPVNTRTYRAALFTEMLHTSSLVHDDLVDNSSIRRGSRAVHTLWKNRAAVWTGDNLFTKSILLLLENQDHGILKIYSDSISKIIEGELLQMEKAKKINLNEDIYYEIIKGKTAHLLAAACAAGAASTFEDPAAIQRLYRFGEKTGMAFQIKDDLLDYSTSDIGKPTGNDLKEKKITLPLIFTLNNCTPALRKELLRIIKNQGRDRGSDRERLAYLTAAVKRTGGLDYAEQKMSLFRDEALEIIGSFTGSGILTAPDVLPALEDLVRYTTDRLL